MKKKVDEKLLDEEKEESRKIQLYVFIFLLGFILFLVSYRYIPENSILGKIVYNPSNSSGNESSGQEMPGDRICLEEDKRCSNKNAVEQCINNSWQLIEQCIECNPNDFSCSIRCNEKQVKCSSDNSSILICSNNSWISYSCELGCDLKTKECIEKTQQRESIIYISLIVAGILILILIIYLLTRKNKKERTDIPLLVREEREADFNESFKKSLNINRVFEPPPKLE